MTQNKIRIDLSAIIYKEDDWWIAHCLELDLPAEGETPEAALKALFELTDTHIKNAIEEGDLESIFRAAPPELWRMFALASDAPRSAKRVGSIAKTKSPINRFTSRRLALANN